MQHRELKREKEHTLERVQTGKQTAASALPSNLSNAEACSNLDAGMSVTDSNSMLTGFVHDLSTANRAHACLYPLPTPSSPLSLHFRLLQERV